MLLVNRSPTTALVYKTPYEAWGGLRPSLSHPRVFGCDAFVHVPKEKRSKLDRKSEKCIFIWYKDGVKGYKLWNLVKRKAVYSRDVVFRDVNGNRLTWIEEVERENKPEKVEFELINDSSESTQLVIEV